MSAHAIGHVHRPVQTLVDTSCVWPYYPPLLLIIGAACALSGCPENVFSSLSSRRSTLPAACYS